MFSQVIGQLTMVAGLSIDFGRSPFVIACWVSAAYLFIFTVYYLFNWALSGIVTAVILACVAAPVLFAKFVHVLNPNNAFAGLVFIVFVLTVFF
jgi:hypothetical protein